MKRKLNKRAFILLAVAIVTAICGIWLLLSPRMERDYVYAAQKAMLGELLQDIQSTSEPPEPAAVYMDYVETDSQDEYVYSLDYIEEYTADYDYEIESHDPIPDNAFPNAIYGIGILTIDAIGLQLPIAEGVDETTLRIAPGRVPQTAQIGETGNAVIAGHRNYAHGSMFNRLGELEYGDIVQYQARNGEKMEFVVFEIAVIEPHDQVAFLQPVNDAIITLYTCTPIRTATHRLIIRAQRIR